MDGLPESPACPTHPEILMVLQVKVPAWSPDKHPLSWYQLETVDLKSFPHDGQRASPVAPEGSRGMELGCLTPSPGHTLGRVLLVL